MIRFLLCIFVCSACAGTKKYPEHWWATVPKEQAKSWEILPDQAKDGEVILSKRNELGLLSNFAATPFILDGKKYASLEGFWQMMKFPEGSQDERHQSSLEWGHTRGQVAQMVGFKAKRAGDHANQNMQRLGIQWVTYKGKKVDYLGRGQREHYQLIKRATWAKVRQNPEVKRVLLATGDLKLRPDHHQKANRPRAWRYYEIYMDIRKQLTGRE